MPHLQAEGLAMAPLSALLLILAVAVAPGCTTHSAPVVPPGVRVNVTPPFATVFLGGQVAFGATVTGAAAATVTWSVEPPGCGTVTATGAFTAPSSAATCTVRALSTADSTVSGTATVTVVAPSSDGAPGGGGTTYHVGPGQPYANIGDVPWYGLVAGDTVYIHYRATPYREKLLISGRGTPTQWIRVLGVPGPAGELPIISGDGATTSTNMHYRWQDVSATSNAVIQTLGVVQIAVQADPASGTAPIPGYIEVANLQIQDGFETYQFTAENGTRAPFDGFAACIYARSPQHLLVRDNVLTNCGQGFYNWTGGGSVDLWWDGLAIDVVVRRNSFFNNGNPASYTEHQSYTEADGVIIEGNFFGPQRVGALGSQLKDRSAGTVIRYNYIVQSPYGWDIDLVEPQEGCPSLCFSTGATVRPNPKYLETFVYGNAIVNQDPNGSGNYVHWNEDHQQGRGRALEPDGRLYFYDNTIVCTTSGTLRSLFNETWGAYECPTGALPGRIDLRNNILYNTAASYKLGEWCYFFNTLTHMDFGVNWVSPGFQLYVAESTGSASLVSPAGNDPGFVNLSGDDYRLAAGSSALGLGQALAPAVTSNSLGLDLTPVQQYVSPASPGGVPALVSRPQAGAGSDLGAYER
jgi:hypothetical protein